MQRRFVRRCNTQLSPFLRSFTYMFKRVSEARCCSVCIVRTATSRLCQAPKCHCWLYAGAIVCCKICSARQLVSLWRPALHRHGVHVGHCLKRWSCLLGHEATGDHAAAWLLVLGRFHTKLISESKDAYLNTIRALHESGLNLCNLDMREGAAKLKTLKSQPYADLAC